MDFIDQIKELSDKVSELIEHVEMEEATKNALIMPFIRALGYDVFNPKEVKPEYTCDFAEKQGKKVDYAIIKDGKPFMLFECKAAHVYLNNNYASQLRHYFTDTDVKLAVLANGVIYKFYTDIEKSHVMDTKPFLEFDMRDIDYTLVEELEAYGKDSSVDIAELHKRAKKLKYSKQVKEIFEKQLDSPSGDFVNFFIKGVYSGAKPRNIRKEFEAIIPVALKEFIAKKCKDSVTVKPPFTPEIDDDDAQGNGGENGGNVKKRIVTTPEEQEGFNIVREILQEITNIDRVVLKDLISYCHVLLDNKKRICTFYFDKKQKYIGLFDSKGEEKVPIDKLSDIHNYADKLKATIEYYDGLIDIKAIQLKFWDGFKEYVQSESTSLRLTHKPHPQHWYNINLGRSKSHIGLSVNTKSNVLTCEIYIPDSKELYYELLKHKDEIEDELNETLEWLELPDKNASRVKISKSGNIKEPDEREEQFEWFKTQAELFQKVFQKYIR